MAWGGVDSRKIRRWRGLFAALLVVLGAAVAAPEARAAVLVSNIGQQSDDTGTANRIAQPFRTGAHADGYTLTSITLLCGACNTYTGGTVTLHNGIRTGTKVADFTITLNAEGNLLATPTTATTLSAGTTYVIVTANDFGSRAWFTAGNNALDSISAAGWTIPVADQEFYHTGTMVWVATTGSNQFRVDGDPVGSTPTPTNNAPVVANAIPDQTATAGSDFSYTFPDTTFTDADSGDTLSYTVTKADDTNLPTWLGFDADTRTFKGTPMATDVETVAVKVIADDSNGGTVSDEFNIVVEADTTPPTLTSATVRGDGSIILLQFSEPVARTSDKLPQASAVTVTADGSAVTVSEIVDPEEVDQIVIVVDNVDLIYQGQVVVVTYTDPTAGDDTRAIQDTSGNDAATFTTGMSGVAAVTNNSVEPPIAPFAPTGLTATASGTTTINLSWTAPVNNGGSVITGYKIEISPDGGSTTWTDQVANTASTTTTYEHTGLAASTTRHYRVSAINSIGASTPSDAADATTGTAANNAPVVAIPIPDQTATEGALFSYAFPDTTFTDADSGDTLSYTATKGDDTPLPTWLTFTPATRTFTGTPAAADVETVAVKVTANDSNGGLISDVFDIVVAANNAPVVENPIPDQAAPVGATFDFTFGFTAFSDADSDTLSYMATQAAGTALPTWLSFAAVHRRFSGTPQAADVGVVSVKVTASDGKGGSVSDEFDITVEVDTTPPTLSNVTVHSGGLNIILGFSEPVGRAGATRPQASAFTVTADGIAVPVDQTGDLSGQVDVIVVQVAPVRIRQGQAVVVTYTDPTTGDDTRAIQDRVGNDAASFTTGVNSVPAVTNSSTRAAVAPDAPTGLTATASGADTINLSWTAPVDNGGSVITGYKIEVSIDSGTTWTDLVADTASTTTTYEHTGLAASTTRHYRVSAINSIGTGTTPSDVVDATTGPPTMTGGTTFISNTGRSGGGYSDAIRAQAFTTGTGTYTLSSVAITLGPQSGSPPSRWSRFTGTRGAIRAPWWLP